MSLVSNSYSNDTLVSDLKLTVTTGTSQEIGFTIEPATYTNALLTAADAAADAAIAEYTTQVYTGDSASLHASAADLSAVDGSYVVADAGAGTATFTVVIASNVATSVTLLSAGTGYTADATVTLAGTAADGTVLGGTAPAIRANITGSSGDAGVITAATRAAAADAATAAGLTVLAAAITDAADDAAAKDVLDAAITGTGAIAAAITIDTAGLTAAMLADGNYRIAYSDAIGAVNYSSANAVQVIQFTMKDGVMLGSHAKLSNVKSDKVFASTGGPSASDATKITGSIIGLVNGTGYGIQVTHLGATINRAGSVGTGNSAARVIVNGGPVALNNDFRVTLTAVSGDNDSARVEFKLAGSDTAQHTTGNYGDLAYLRLMWSNCETCVFHTEDIDLSQATVYDGGNKLLINRQLDLKDPVATTLFEYSAALVDKAGAVSSFASTGFASSVANNANNVQGIAINGNSVAGTDMKVNWTKSTFTAKTIVGYEIITQKLATGTAALADSSLVGDDGVTPFICNIDHGSNTITQIPVASLQYKITTAAVEAVWTAGNPSTAAAAAVYSDSVFEKTLTGLDARANYAVWIRAYHAESVKGSIGLDKMSAPSEVYVADIGTGVYNSTTGLTPAVAGLRSFDATKHSWAGSYIQTAIGATPISQTQYETANATSGSVQVALFMQESTSVTTGVIDELTGKPSDLTSSIVLLSGKYVQSDDLTVYNSAGVATLGSIQPEATVGGDNLMETSLAFKWEDKDISLQGMNTGRKMQYVCFEKSEYDKLNASQLAEWYAGSLVQTAQVGAPGTSDYATAIKYAVDWEDMISGTTYGIGDGELTAATYNSLAKNTSTRYCRFQNSFGSIYNTASNGTVATFNSNGSLAGNAGEGIVLPKLHTVTIAADDTLSDIEKGSSAAALVLGKEYVFALRVVNSNGASAIKTFTEKAVTGRASAATFLHEDAAVDGDATDLIDARSLLWDTATNKFVIKMTDKHVATTEDNTSDDVILFEPTGARPDNMSYEAIIHSAVIEDAHGLTNVNAASQPAYRVSTEDQADADNTAGGISSVVALPITCTKSVSDRVTTVSFDKVWAKALTYTSSTATDGTVTYTEVPTATYSLVSLSALKGYKFEIKLVAKNDNGARTIVSSAPLEGTFTFTGGRQVFGSKATFEAIATVATNVKPANDTTTTPTTVFPDVRKKDAVTTLANVQPNAYTPSATATESASGTAANIYMLSADIKDLTKTQFDTVGRKIDTIKYEVFQTLSDGTHKTVLKDIVAPTGRAVTSTNNSGVTSTTPSSDAYYMGKGLPLVYERPIQLYQSDGTGGYAATPAVYGTDNNMPNKFNTWVPESAIEYGYKLQMKISLVSTAANDFAELRGKASLLASAEDYVTAEKTIQYTTRPFDDHDEVSQMTVTPGDQKMTVYWSAPDMAATEMQGADGEVPTLTGYQIEVYDMVSRNSGKIGTTTDDRKFRDEGVNNAGEVSKTDALSTPFKLIPASTLDATMTSYEITGLKNGKNYVPIIRTVTNQAGSSVLSAGRTIKANIGISASAQPDIVKHDVKVFYADTNTLAYTAARWKAVNFVASVQNANENKTSVVLNDGSASLNGGSATSANKTIVIPFGAPIITADLTADSNSLKVDNNGSELLFGAMLQTAPGGTNPTPGALGAQRIGSTANAVSGMDNVFYLDLSFGGAGVGVTPFDNANDPAIYTSPVGQSDAGTAYPGRKTVSVASQYLGENWTQESNYLFASNAAGTTVGKIVGGAYTAL